MNAIPEMRGTPLPLARKTRIVATVSLDAPTRDADNVIHAVRVAIARLDAALLRERDGDNARMKTRLRVDGVPQPTRLAKSKAPRTAKATVDTKATTKTRTRRRAEAA